MAKLNTNFILSDITVWDVCGLQTDDCMPYFLFTNKVQAWLDKSTELFLEGQTYTWLYYLYINMETMWYISFYCIRIIYIFPFIYISYDKRVFHYIFYSLTDQTLRMSVVNHTITKESVCIWKIAVSLCLFAKPECTYPICTLRALIWK